VVTELIPSLGPRRKCQFPKTTRFVGNAVQRLRVQVTFDQQRGYVAVAEGLPIITALSLASLRRQIDARVTKGVIPQLQLDKRARRERDARRQQAAR
jgi:hypothetical protein